MTLKLRIAGIPVGIAPRHGVLKDACLPFVDEGEAGEPLFTVGASDADLDFERAMAPEYPEPYLELCAVHRNLAERFAPLDRIVFHS